MKVYCVPVHIVDTHSVYFVLDEDCLYMIRIPIAASMIFMVEHSDAFYSLDGFKEVAPQELASLAQKHATKESVDKFIQVYYDTYLKHGSLESNITG